MPIQIYFHNFSYLPQASIQIYLISFIYTLAYISIINSHIHYFFISPLIFHLFSIIHKCLLSFLLLFTTIYTRLTLFFFYLFLIFIRLTLFFFYLFLIFIRLSLFLFYYFLIYKCPLTIFIFHLSFYT